MTWISYIEGESSMGLEIKVEHVLNQETNQPSYEINQNIDQTKKPIYQRISFKGRSYA